ncbi:hypothetical protein E4656_13665 [Natronospirillum operosum]|uniref:Mor transcription activator domain-containing protein n=1 Tax=Natronospirillum operosum TaxID=2759953 RepID=A0A4Z0WD49_9GAMM|nr:Mor transcription activator family protein [Natronospirillum operosum]TGG92514.1 hypothetical protein E4656_13665 [Natronospirillum operosum]
MNAYQSLSADNLPESLAEIVDAIGLESALKLVEALPGVRVYVPQQMPADHQLVTILGQEAAMLLAEHFGGEALNVARCLHALRGVRNTEIWQARHLGAARLALRFGLTERQVYSILAQVHANQDQMDLFSTDTTESEV